MIKKFSRSVASSLCNKTDNQGKIELYEYAVFIALTSILHILSIFALGILLNVLLESVIFYVAFVVVRKFAGGFHAKTPTRCYVFSVVTISISLILIKAVELFSTWWLIAILLGVCAISVGIICYFSPIENANNPLGEKEKNTYKKIAIIGAILVYILATIFCINTIYNVGVSLIFALFMNSIVVIMAKVIK